MKSSGHEQETIRIRQMLHYVGDDMNAFDPILKSAVAAFVIFFINLSPAPAAEPPAELFDALAAADAEQAGAIAEEIRGYWSQSGSDAMDLLLDRGRKALEAGDARAAVEHLTALTDHAPEFAEGWHVRAQAFHVAQLSGPALADLERALTLSPRHFDAMFGLAIILDQTGAPEDALSVLRMVRIIYPHHPDMGPAMERLEIRLRGSVVARMRSRLILRRFVLNRLL